jgi:hypothetical protein
MAPKQILRAISQWAEDARQIMNNQLLVTCTQPLTILVLFIGMLE